MVFSGLFLNGGMLLPRIHALNFNNRLTAFISITGVAASVFAVSFSSSFIVYIVIYGALFGVFIGFGYISPFKNCIEHIPDRKGNFGK
jgi:hypothetical protein